MNASSLATALLGRHVRLVYFDGWQMGYVLLVRGRPVHADSQFTVLDDQEW